MSKIVALVPLLPLLGFLINGLLRKQLSKTAAGIIGSGTVLGAFIISVLLFIDVRNGKTGVVEFFPFISFDTVKIPFAFLVDQLTAIYLLIITGVGFLIHVYSTAYMHDEEAPHFARYFAYLNLFVFSMLLLVLGANYVIMFIGWEGVGLCSYLLIGYWFKNPQYNNAAKKAFVMNRIGDLGFLLAVFWLLAKLSTVTYGEVFSADAIKALSQTDITIITLLFFVAATGKSAQIPLYTWLPDAMAGPTPVSALIHAATMVTAGIYLVARTNILFSMAETTQHVIAWIGVATALLAATIAVKQNDIKKVLAYSTVSQLGYMFLALGMGAYTAAVFHVMTHAFFKALLFLGSGSVIHAMGGEQDIRKMGGLAKHMKITYFTFLIGCLAIAGVPMFSGFFSKDAILLSAYEHNKIIWGIALLVAALTTFYMFRLLFLTFKGSFRGTEEQQHHLHESPRAMTIPLIILGVLSIVGGYISVPEVFVAGGDKLGQFLAPIIPLHTHAVSHMEEYALMGGTTLLVAIVIVFAWNKYKTYKEETNGAFGNLLENKWYVDELYNTIIVKPINWLAGFIENVLERSGIDAIVNGVGRAVQYSSRQLRLLQSGQVGSYVLLMIAGMVLLFVLQFFLKK
ncbi:MAG: NADH-quinone oxidoreductase subunit L [Sphingobacteriales bacterium]|nr:MAG: NADH-quinone oxidoreductase subunit L [Sphingobacteriales bacterium]